MPIILRQIVWDLFATLTVALTATTGIISLCGGVLEGIRRGLPPAVVVSILPYVLPEVLVLTLPASCLFACCSVFGRMAADNEILALKSAGVHPLNLLWPVVILCLPLSVISYWLYDARAIWGRPGMQRAVIHSVEQIAYSMLESEHAYCGDKISIAVRGVEGRKLLSPKIVIEPGKDQSRAVIQAEEARIEWDEASDALQAVCCRGRVNVAGVGSYVFHDEFRVGIPVAYQVPPREGLTPANLAMSEIPGQIEHEQRAIGEITRLVAEQRSAGQAPNPKLAEPLRLHQQRWYRLCTEHHRRWANGWSCLGFGLLGAAVAVRWRISDTLKVFFMCFLPILVVFYPLLMLGEKLAINGDAPRVAVWTADVLLCLALVPILRKVVRY